MAEMNFAEFQMKVLRGIGYSNISTTNRAYQWIKNNSSIDGPCLNYLKSYVTEDNFISQKEMNLYKEIANNQAMPIDEEEIDKALSEFYCDYDSMPEFAQADICYIENEMEKSESYLKELEFMKKLLQRQHNKLQDEVNVLKHKNQIIESNIDNLMQRSEKIDIKYEDTSKKILEDLNKIANTFHKLIKESMTEEEHNVFRINFEIFKKINHTFGNTVDSILEKQFGKIPKARSNESDRSSDQSLDLETSANKTEEYMKKAEDLVFIALSLGKRTFENLMIKCEEAELNELLKFLNSLKSELNGRNSVTSTGIACLQAQISVNKETIEDLKNKSNEIQITSEKFYRNSTLQEVFVTETFKLEQKVKHDKKCLRKISELCSKYIDLIALQACFLENERENVTLAVDLYNRAVTTLDTQVQTHSRAMVNFEKLKKQHKEEKYTNCFINFALGLIDIDDKNQTNMLQTFSDTVHEIKSKMISLIGNKFRQILSLQTVIVDLDKIVFNGPSKQPFYIVDFLIDKRNTELQYVKYNKIYRSFKTKYLEELEKLNNDEYLKMEKLLWIMFLTNPTALQENLQDLRRSAGANKSLALKRTASLFSLADKANGTTY